VGVRDYRRRMGYRVLAETTMVVHFAVLVFLVVGGFLAWRWRPVIWPHLAIATWGLTSTVFVWACPLTMLQDWARRRGGEAGLRTGFIDTYLTGVIYPERYTTQIQVSIGVVVALSWVGVVLVRRRRRLVTVPAGTPDKTDISESAAPAH
jgi:Na+/proline symporter